MAHRKLTAEQVAELIMAEEAEGEEGELSDSDCSVAEIDSHQPSIPKDNSDVTDTLDVEDSELDIEDEDDTDVPEDPENYFATKDPSVKWKMIGNRRDHTLAINIVDANSIGPTQIVPTHFESPLDALKLTLPDDILFLVIRYTNQKYKRYCHDHP